MNRLHLDGNLGWADRFLVTSGVVVAVRKAKLRSLAADAKLATLGGIEDLTARALDRGDRDGGVRLHKKRIA